ncbi:DNA-3-methyladenine glycosylase I [Iodobacter fluviatilis]|uniref:DNA-3-methyladenine glycosylase I n=1 Tax=Iodobacter fluviatilis TaxID=537 RepID=A0A377Q4P2_9NEIS|nr:DNA-3-methyladenine glycosylase I [Iodobacter fluviatilis]TCU84158.1 DNA-3-methyladenine glycosylase I [Iodobacter fluviatilis]STQ89772.1 DNA-3-methyladenine glycosylase 1 [Iodobacter fluviatilis]
MSTSDLSRCTWCSSDPLYQNYHDHEWGQPLFDDQALFELLCLEGAQAGLSWITVLKKREHYRVVFDHFDAQKIATYDADKIASLLSDTGIIRNRAKVAAFISNAAAYLQLKQAERFSDFLWSFVNGKTIVNQWANIADTPVATAESIAMSKALKKRGFKFVGPTICYAFMQASGMVDDHSPGCWKRTQSV